MIVHQVKCWSPFYNSIVSGVKTFEIRFNDRNYREGDILWLHDYDKVSEKYTGHSIKKIITYILWPSDSPGLTSDYICMALSNYAEE